MDTDIPIFPTKKWGLREMKEQDQGPKAKGIFRSV